MIRLFAGIELPENIKEQLFRLRGGVPNAQWVEKDNLHITLRFIGNIEESDASYLHDSFMQLQMPAFELQIAQVGYFANGSQMKHLWAGINNYQALDFLHSKIDNVLMRHKISQDKHKFHAHTTLAKLRGSRVDDVHRFLEYNNLFRSEEFTVDHFTLFSSHKRRHGDGSYYRAEAEYPLFGYWS